MKDDYVNVGDARDIASGQMKRVTVNGHRLLVVNDRGNYFAVDEMCSHEEYSLFFGCVSDGKLKCSLHGSRFDLATGSALDDPAHEPINTYAVEIEDHQIRIRT